MNEAEVLDTVLDTVESIFVYCISGVIYFISEEIHKFITIKLWGNIKIGWQMFIC